MGRHGVSCLQATVGYYLIYRNNVASNSKIGVHEAVSTVRAKLPNIIGENKSATFSFQKQQFYLF